MRQRTQTIVIDGANAIHAIFEPWPGSLEEQNKLASDFINYLAAWLERELELEIEIVFDGGYRFMERDSNGDRLRIMFSGHENADTIIIERVRALRYFKRKVIVITRDRILAEDVRRETGVILSPERLWELMKDSSNY